MSKRSRWRGKIWPSVVYTELDASWFAGFFSSLIGCSLLIRLLLAQKTEPTILGRRILVFRLMQKNACDLQVHQWRDRRCWLNHKVVQFY